ncbi:MAG: hypothetical protein ACLUFI_09290 [Oscillospiraceae bacterium]
MRAEEVVTSEYDTTVLACAEGAHVAANDVVATGYRSDDAKTRKTRMDELTGQIEQLQYAWSAASSVYDQAAIDSSIADSLSHLSQYLARRDMNSVSTSRPSSRAHGPAPHVGRGGQRLLAAADRRSAGGARHARIAGRGRHQRHPRRDRRDFFRRG